MDNKKAHKNINLVFSRWNPIELPRHVASSAYRSYVPKILDQIHSVEGMMRVLDEMVTEMGVTYKVRFPELDLITKLIFKVLKEPELFK